MAQKNFRFHAGVKKCHFGNFFRMGWDGCAMLVRPLRIPHRNSKVLFALGAEFKMVGPKKQAFCPIINAERNFDTNYFELLMIISSWSSKSWLFWFPCEIFKIVCEIDIGAIACSFYVFEIFSFFSNFFHSNSFSFEPKIEKCIWVFFPLDLCH